MRYFPAFVSVVALTLPSCSSGPPALPEDIIGSAATCAVVTASQARAAITDPTTPLKLDQQSQVIQYALLAGAADPAFSRDNANGVVKRMQAIADRIDKEKEWQPLAPLCKTAFPAADPASAVTIPEAAEEAQIDCYVLGDFMVRALGAYEETYRDAAVKYNGMLNKLDPLVKEQLEKRGIKAEDHAAQSAEKNKALAVAAKLGPIAKTLDMCMQRFPPDMEIKLPK